MEKRLDKIFICNISLLKKNSYKVIWVDNWKDELIIFRNDDSSFHEVKKMENSINRRHFLYGGFTINNGAKNPFIKLSKKAKTNFFIYY